MRTFNGTRNGRSRSGCWLRSRIRETWAIVNAMVAPNAYSPPRNSTSAGITSPNEITAPIRIATCGVVHLRPSLPSQLGICRFVART